MRFDLNCDLGEGEPVVRTKQLLAHVTSANIACGGHAGDVTTMQQCVRLAKKYRVRVGAHPGLWDKENFGRSDDVVIDARELEVLLLQQVSAFERIAAGEKVRLHHIKLHGALYHAAERDPRLAGAYLKIVRSWWPKAIVYALAGGTVARSAPRAGVEVWQEAFLDRNYRDDGSLVPRSEADALVGELSRIKDRLSSLSTRGGVTTCSGGWLPVSAQTLCIHSDTPHAAQIVRALRARSSESGRRR
jgi:UPF0271 protein